MQSENKMEWWFSFVSVLVVITAVITLAFSVTAFLIAGNAGKNAERAADSIERVAKDFSITVRTEPLLVEKNPGNENGSGTPSTPTGKTENGAFAGNAETDKIPEPATTEKSSVTLYVVREYNGKIGVFSSDGGLLRTVSVMVSALPVKDRDALAAGIHVTSFSELNALLEDFS